MTFLVYTRVVLREAMLLAKSKRTMRKSQLQIGLGTRCSGTNQIRRYMWFNIYWPIETQDITTNHKINCDLAKFGNGRQTQFGKCLL